MYVLFTTSQLPLARLIRWATGEDCSHVAIREGNWIYHSNIKGVHVEHLNDFLKKNKVVHSIPIPVRIGHVHSAYSKYKGSKYDTAGLLFAGFVLFCRKALNLRSWPKVNLWQSSGMFMCTEFVNLALDREVDSLITPGQLYRRLSNEQRIRN